MNLPKMIKRLQELEKEITDAGGDAKQSRVMIEAITDEGDIYYEDSIGFFVDDNNDIGLSPINK